MSRILSRNLFSVRLRAPALVARPFASEARGHTAAGSKTSTASSKSFDDTKLDKGFKERVKAMNPEGSDINQQSGAHGAGDGFGKGSGSPATKLTPQSHLHESAGSSTSTASSSSAATGAFNQGGAAPGSSGASTGSSRGMGSGDQSFSKTSSMGTGEWGPQPGKGAKQEGVGLGTTDKVQRDAGLGLSPASSEHSSHQSSGMGRSPSAGSMQGLGQGGIGSPSGGEKNHQGWYEAKLKKDRSDTTENDVWPASSSSSMNKTSGSGLGSSSSSAYGTQSSSSASSGMDRNPSASDANSSWKPSGSTHQQSAPMSQSSGFGYGNHASGSAAQTASTASSSSTPSAASDFASDAKGIAGKLREKGHELKEKIKDTVGKVMKSDDDGQAGRGQ